MRLFQDDSGESWQAMAVDHVVAHGKMGAALVFVPANEPSAEPLRTGVTFNSTRAADLTLRTLGEKELRRRLKVARAEAAG
ncbi:MAG TPA: hypothetical protein VFI91_10570 [Longimicrobiaceae bacterium]|nr:hypothetical protein [Longimicrobiaceae bacterium]